MQSRKTFLATGALAALAPQLAASAPAQTLSTAAPTATPSPGDDIPDLRFDLSTFNAALAGAKHHHLYASIQVDEGEVFSAARNTLIGYKSLSVPYADVLPAVALYHGFSIAMAFDDAIWNDLFEPYLAKSSHLIRAKAGKFKTGRGNPYLHKDKSAGVWDSSIDGLVADAGLRIFVCNLATRGHATAVARTLKLHPNDVYERLAGGLVQNAMLVPSGVWGIHAIQERGFTLLQTSL